MCDECAHIFDVPASGDRLHASLSATIALPILDDSLLRATTPPRRDLAPTPPREAESVDEIDCPACAETIKAAARICRFCNHVIGDPVPGAPPPPLSRAEKRALSRDRLARRKAAFVTYERKNESVVVRTILGFFLIVVIGLVAAAAPFLIVWLAVAIVPMLFFYWLIGYAVGSGVKRAMRDR